MNERSRELVAKVPQVTLLFWIIKILATTLGETGGDAVTMSWLGETTSAANGTGYLIGTAIFGVIFIAAVLVQIKAKKFHPFLYWLTIVATTTVGTTLADYCTRSLGIGYTGGSTILLDLRDRVASDLALVDREHLDRHGEYARRSRSSIGSRSCSRRRLGTALGDWVADTNGMGYLGAAASLRRAARCDRSSLLFHEHLPRHFVLGRIYPDAPARGRRRRFSRQAGRARRAGSQPLHRFARALGGDRPLDPDLPAKAGPKAH